MNSLRLHIPERNAPADHAASSWPEIPPQDGLIRLSEPAAFNLEPAGLRWFSVDVLAGLYDPDLPENGIRLPVAPHFELVAYPRIELIEDQDDDMLRSLRELAAGITLDQGAVERRRVLRAKIEDIIDFFYA